MDSAQYRYLKNWQSVTNHGNSQLRSIAADIIEHSLLAADPYISTKERLHLEGEVLQIDNLRLDLKKYERIFIFGAGKATYPIVYALEEILGERITGGLVVLKRGSKGNLKHVEVIFGAHPVPDEDGHRGAKAMFEMASACTERDLVLTAITGGSSALLPLPVDGVSLDDKKRVNEILLFCGADITQINAVRKHLSKIKGGRLAKAILSATLINLTVSDVNGDPLDYITCPTVPDTSTFEDARKVLDEFDLWEKFPKSAADHLQRGSKNQETPKENDFKGEPLHTFILVNSAAACLAAEKRGKALGYQPMILTTMMKGEARDSGTLFASVGVEISKFGRPLKPPCVVIAGGENTVTIHGEYGMGGPNQEFVLSAALDIAGLENIVIASLDTDGTDGPNELAGGMVDGRSIAAARDRNLDVPQALRKHNVTPVLRNLRDELFTGPTGTNINDLKLLLVS